MKRIRNLVYFVGIFFIFISQSFSQAYNMSNSIVSACSGTFYDSGGENDDYGKNENLTMSFTPGTTGSVLKFTFSEFDLESHPQCNKDYLRIYDGGVATVNLIDEYCGTNSPGTIMATNASGAITFVFRSDNKNTNYPGWVASIECVTTGTSFTGIWTGNTSNDWSLSSNWDDGNVPGYLTDVTISASPSGGNFPETNLGNEAVCNDLSIASGGHLYIPSNNALTVFGAITNNANTFGLIIKSDVNGSGSLIHSNTGVNATIEQYLTSERWHLVSPPISNATINTYLYIYLKEWNEPDSTWTYLVEPVTTPMNITRGYAAWASDSYTGTTTISYPGTMVTTDQSVNISYSNQSSHLGKGFNLIGNPYPCSLDWNTNWNMNKMSGWMVVYNNGVFQGYHTNGTSYNGKTDGIIPPTQGFWVRATQNNPSMTIPSSERLHSNQAFYKNTKEETYPIVRLESIINGFTDEAVVVFHPECTEMFDGYFDLQKFTNVLEAPQLSVISNDTLYAVSFFDNNYNDKVIELGFKTGAEGLYSIAASSISNFDNSINIYLEDIKTKSITTLKESEPYNFSYHPLDDEHRFNLHFRDSWNGFEDLKLREINIYSNDQTVYVKMQNQDEVQVSIYNVVGQLISRQAIYKDELAAISVNTGTGYYIVRVKTDSKILTQKIFIK